VRTRDRSTPTPKEVAAALRARAAVDWGAEFLQRHGANAMSVGWKMRAGRRTGDVSLRIFVDPGVKSTRRKGVDFVRKRLSCGQTDSGRELTVVTDVDEARRPRLSRATDPNIVHRRIPGGVSIGVPGTVGTFGGSAWDEVDQSIVLLSAAHVFGDVKDVPVSQPALLDRLARPVRRIGSVKDSAPRSLSHENTIDAATARFDRPLNALLSVLEVGPAIMAVGVPDFDLPVEKFGKQSRLTRGTVTDPYWRGWVGLATGEWMLYGDCMRVEEVRSGAWAVPGDSGSVVFARKALEDGSGIKPAIGLHFASDESDPHVGIACRIDNVFEALGLSSFPDGLLRYVVETSLGSGEVGRVRGLLRELRGELNTGPGGREVLGLMDEHRVAFVAASLRNEEARDALVRLTQRLFSGATSADVVLRAPLSASVLDSIEHFLRVLRERAHGSLRRSCTTLLRRVSGTEGKTLRDVLGLTGGGIDDAVSVTLGGTVPTTALYQEYADMFGEELMRKFGAIAIGVGRSREADSESGVVLRFFVFPEEVAAARQRIPGTLTWDRPGQPSVKLRTAVESTGRIEKR